MEELQSSTSFRFFLMHKDVRTLQHFLCNQSLFFSTLAKIAIFKCGIFFAIGCGKIFARWNFLSFKVHICLNLGCLTRQALPISRSQSCLHKILEGACNNEQVHVKNSSIAASLKQIISLLDAFILRSHVILMTLKCHVTTLCRTIPAVLAPHVCSASKIHLLWT